MTAPNFRTYTDAEFLRWAEAEHDPLTASLVETELLRRFASLLDRAEVGDELADVCGDHGLDASRADLAARLEQPGEWADKKVGELTDLLAELEIEDHTGLRFVNEIAKAALAHDLDTPEALTKELERIRRFDALMNDLTQPLKDLAELAPN